MRSPARGRPDDVAEHGPRLDRRELAGVADQDQTRLRANGLDQPGHHRQRDHRRLVDDHDVVRQSVRAVVTEAAVAAGKPAEEPVERRRAELAELLSDGVADVELRRLLVNGLLQPRGGLGGRCGERDERRGRSRGGGLFGEQGHDPGDGGGLARAGAAGDDREPPQHRGGGGQSLPGVRAGAGLQRRHRTGDRGRRSARRRGRPGTARRRTRGGPPRRRVPRASTGRGRARSRRVGAGPRLRSSSSPTATSGVPDSRAIQSSTAGQSSVDRSTSSSDSTVAVSRIVARST